LHFRGEKMAKVIGSLAASKPEHSKSVSGILLKKGFNYHIMAPSDLQNYTDLSTSKITQRQIIGFHASWQSLQKSLVGIAGKVEQFISAGKPALGVFEKRVVVYQERNAVVIEWLSNPENDMYADAVLIVVLETEGNPNEVKMIKTHPEEDGGNFQQHLMKLLNDKYGEKNVVESEEGDIVTVDIDGVMAAIDLETLLVDCADETLRHLVSALVNNLNQAMTPLTTN